MTKQTEALKLALEALKRMKRFGNTGYRSHEQDPYRQVCEAITALEELAEQPAQQEPVAHSVVAGALFDFMGWLTSRKERIVLSSADNASPAVEAITEFAKMRNLSLDDAKVQDWNTTPPQRKPLTDRQILADETLRYYFGQNGGAGPVSKQGRRVVDAIEAAHGIKE